MSVPVSASPSSEGSRHPWRDAALWTAFLATLVVGLVLALRFGASAPVLLDVVSL